MEFAVAVMISLLCIFLCGFFAGLGFVVLGTVFTGCGAVLMVWLLSPEDTGLRMG